MIYVWLDWPKDAEEQEIATELLRDKLCGIEHVESTRILLLSGDRDSFSSAGALDELKTGFADVLYLGLTPPGLTEVGIIACLLSAAQEQKTYELIDVQGEDANDDSHCSRDPLPLLSDILKRVDSTANDQDGQALDMTLGACASVFESIKPRWVAATLLQSTAYLRNLLQLEEQLWIGPDPRTSGQIRASSTIHAMKTSVVFDVYQDYERIRELSTGEVRAAIDGRVDFLHFGRAAASGTKVDRFDQQLIALFAWWSVFFRSRAVMLAAAGDYVGGLQCLNRELELFCQCLLLENGLGDLTFAGEFILRGRNVSGLGELLEASRPTIESVVGESHLHALFNASGCRNKSRIGHGVSSLNRPIFDSAICAINDVWRKSADRSIGCASIYRGFSGKVPSRICRKPSKVFGSSIAEQYRQATR